MLLSRLAAAGRLAELALEVAEAESFAFLDVELGGGGGELGGESGVPVWHSSSSSSSQRAAARR